MTTKNLEKLAEIGENKLLDDLNRTLMDIKISENNEDLNKKIKSYEHLIVTCKNCGLDIIEQEKIYTQIIDDGKKYLNEKLKQSLSKLSLKTQYGEEIKN